MNLEKLEPPVYATLRIVAGVLMACHGFGKIFGVIGHTVPLASQLGVGGVLVALGLGTRIAAFILSGEMAVAYFQFHWKLDFSGYKFLPVVNQGELAVVYCFLFLWFCVRGAGRVSLDRVIFQR